MVHNEAAGYNDKKSKKEREDRKDCRGREKRIKWTMGK